MVIISYNAKKPKDCFYKYLTPQSISTNHKLAANTKDLLKMLPNPKILNWNLRYPILVLPNPTLIVKSNKILHIDQRISYRNIFGYHEEEAEGLGRLIEFPKSQHHVSKTIKLCLPPSLHRFECKIIMWGAKSLKK